ncbi:dentin sialophosphoprotein-like [Stegastes partitus]|uniref:Dentin sialophosphoprotein-like n=1 Tax=Stegastes partitus TaxID=144197 RepID=A0A9Y4MPI4_9TELE|nr:PREDICTED: dentin sialophosphoprotein-like [Stegastes partitus]
MEFGVEERPKKVLTGNVTELILKFDPDNPKLRAKGSVVEKRTQKDPAGNDKQESKAKERQDEDREPLLNNQNPAGNDKPEPNVEKPQEKEHEPSLNDQSKNTKCDLQTATATQQPVPVSEVAKEAGKETASPPAHDAAPPAVRPRLASDSSSQDVAGEHRENPSSDQIIEDTTGGTFEEGGSSEPEDIDKSEDKTGLENTEGGPSDSEKASKLLDDQSKDEMSNLQSSPVSEQSESKKEEGEGKESTPTPTGDVSSKVDLPPSSMTEGSPIMPPNDGADEQGKDASSDQVTGKNTEENAGGSDSLGSNKVNESNSPSDVKDPNSEDKGAGPTDEKNSKSKQTQAGEDNQQDSD